MGAICGDGTLTGNDFHERFFDAQGNFLPDQASGYFSRLYQFDSNKPIVPLTVRQLWSKACFCGPLNSLADTPPMNCHQNNTNYRKWFCSNLYDAGGNLISNPAQLPVICGGTGPDVLQPYNPIIAAVNAAQAPGTQLFDTYSIATTDKVKKIAASGLAIALIILIMGALLIYF